MKDALPNIQEEINRQYYYCYGEGAVTVEETGDTVVYIVRGENFQQLLENTYGLDFSDFDCYGKEECKNKKGDNGKLRGTEKHEGKKEYKFECVDIFSPPYVKEVGYPFPE